MNAPGVVSALPRWGFQERLVQPRKAAFWVFALLLLLGGLRFLQEQAIFAEIDTTGLLLSWGLMLVYAVPVVWILLRLDLFEREPASLMAGAFLWGALVATAFSGEVNGFVDVIVHGLLGGDVYYGWRSSIVAPLVEETYKYLGLVALFLIAAREFDDLMDGFVYGALIGLGFTVTENVSYFMGTFGGSVSDVWDGFQLRVIGGGPYSHVLFTGLAGIGFAWFVRHRHDRPLAIRLLGAAGMLGLAMFAHFVWNSPWEMAIEGLGDFVAAAAYRGGPFLITLGIAVWIAGRRERRWLGAALAPEVAAGTLTTDEVRALTERAAGTAQRARRRGAGGPAAVKRLDALRREQLNLAMVRTRVATDDDPDLLRQRARVAEARRAVEGPTAAPVGSADAATTDLVPAAVLAPPPPAWTSDALVPPSGMTAWPIPDGSSAGAVTLAAGLPLRRRSAAGDWAEVEASNGWRGWVDGRRLLPPGA